LKSHDEVIHEAIEMMVSAITLKILDNLKDVAPGVPVTKEVKKEVTKAVKHKVEAVKKAVEDSEKPFDDEPINPPVVEEKTEAVKPPSFDFLEDLPVPSSEPTKKNVSTVPWLDASEISWVIRDKYRVANAKLKTKTQQDALKENFKAIVHRYGTAASDVKKSDWDSFWHALVEELGFE
jgi:hypothetical protein